LLSKTKQTKYSNTMVAASQLEQMVEPNLLHKAVGALLKHHTKTNEDINNLLGNESPIHLTFNLNRVPDRTLVSSRPIRIEIPHALYQLNKDGGGDDDDNNNDMQIDTNNEALEEVEVCLIVKDESKEWILSLIEKFPKQMSYIKKVITLTALRKKYKQYKDRRELCHTYDIFMADDRILPMVGKAIGKQFFHEKKQPIPIKLTRKEALPFVIEKCLRSTFMWISAGTCIAIKAGTTSMPTEHIQKNIQSILNNAVKNIPRKWSNISAISIKTSQSVALPIYNKTREELEEIAQLAKVEATSTSTSSDSKRGNKRSLEEEKNVKAQEKEEVENKKKQKKEAMSKSPLLKAIKKQKKEEAQSLAKVAVVGKKGKKRSTLDADVSTITIAKKEKKGTTSKNGEPALNTESPTKKLKLDNNKNQKSAEKKNKTQKSNDEKSDFIVSKKFNGSKKGYVFKKGEKGVGYYIDVKPVIDEMAMDAIGRANAGSSMKGKSPKNNKKKGGRGRVRRV